MGCAESSRGPLAVGQRRWRLSGSHPVQPEHPEPSASKANPMVDEPIRLPRNHGEPRAFLADSGNSSSSASSNSAAPLPSGQLMATPILIVNMGAEMVYIFEQRLEAQKATDSKRQKVLHDMVQTMCYPRFLEEVFKPQEMYTMQAFKQIFNRLAHSSVMRLTEASMDKLFNIMAMSFKYQLVSCVNPEDILDVTMRHFDTLKDIVGSDSQEFLGLLRELADKMRATFGKMPKHEFVMLRQNILAFLQNRRVKVSLFLQDRIQNADGSFIVPCSGVLPEGRERPGTIRYYNEGAQTSRELLTLTSTDNWEIGPAVKPTLGTNLYARDRAAGKYASNSLSDPPQIGNVSSPEPTVVTHSTVNGLSGDSAGDTSIAEEIPVNQISNSTDSTWAEKVDGPGPAAAAGASRQEDNMHLMEAETPTAAGQQVATVVLDDV